MPDGGDVLADGHGVEILPGKAVLFSFGVKVPVKFEELFPDSASARGLLKMNCLNEPVPKCEYCLFGIIPVRFGVDTAKIG